MTIFVVKTCDGDVYFSTSRNAHKSAAIKMAVEQVTISDLNRYDPESRAAVELAWSLGDEKKLWQALEECGAIRREIVRES